MQVPDIREEMEGRSAREILADFRYGIMAALVFVFAFWIRLIPRDNMDFLQALDPYMIARMSQAVVSEGNLPLLDVWRYFPYTTPTFILNQGDIFIPAYLYHVVSPFMDFVTWAQVYPALAGSLMVVAMYFAGKEMFDRQAGVLAAFFLASAPAVLHRSSAGWFEKEPFAAFLMISSLYFVTRAWKRRSWISGILGGATLGVAMTVWGGTSFLFLLYPIVAFPVALLNEDIEGLVAAFTPTLLVGHVLAAILNPWKLSIPNGMFLVAMAVLGIIWIRYLAESRELVPESSLRYVVPGASLLGGFLLFLSPLYSQTVAGEVQSFVQKIIQNPGGVVGGTVAENQPARAGQIIGQLGAFRSQNVLPAGMASASEFFSGWTLSLIGTAILLTVFVGMLARKYHDKEEASLLAAVLSFGATFILLVISLLMMLPGNPASNFTAFLFAFLIGGSGAGLILIASWRNWRKISIPSRWYLVIPLFWILSTLYGATSKSRLLFLTAQPVALMAGYGLSVGLTEARKSHVWESVRDEDAAIDASRAYRAVAVLLIIPVLLFNGAAAYGMAQGVGGSPNNAWMENLDFMREETPIDSVILSWWDYGYWFETIGERAAIADGGNLGFYAEGEKINFPLADFLTSEDYTEHLDWLQGLSVDYVVLDSSMIGKYSAVSQIHNRDNSQFNAMQTVSCRSRNNQCLTTSNNNQTYLVYESRGTRFLVPFEQSGGRLEISGKPLMQDRRGVAPVSNVCSTEGVREVDVPANQSALPGCVSFHPYRQHQTLVYIPPEVVDSTLVRLYIMDAPDMPHFDEVFDNGYVKMWKVDYEPNQ